MEKKFQGALLGLAVGDAMGGPLEFMSQTQIQIKHGVVTTMIGGGWLDLRPGQTTDDTTLMMATAESLLEKGGIDKADLVKRYMAWYRTNPRDIGQTTRTILTAVDFGENIENAASNHDQELSGKNDDTDFLPRCLPLALLYAGDPMRLMKETMVLATMTHLDKKVASGAAAIHVLLSRILQGETDKNKILEQAGQILDEEDAVYNVLPEVKFLKADGLRTSVHLPDLLETAIWAWWKMKNYRDTITTIINLGGDTDTIAAISGSLAGAYYGFEQIPLEWLGKLENKNIIAGLAKKLYKKATML